MANKIFVSYKYSDAQVQGLPGRIYTTARHYVDELGKMIDASDHIYKGENDGESMKSLADPTIGSKLGDKIFDSSVTIVLITKGMKETFTAENDQWIPWEISYSLKVQSREGGNSKTNAVLAVVIPDEMGSYEYYITENIACNSVTYHTDRLFQILRENMFNHKNKESNLRECNGSKIYTGFPSYIYSVKWSDFTGRLNHYIDIALSVRRNIDDYEIIKSVK